MSIIPLWHYAPPLEFAGDVLEGLGHGDVVLPVPPTWSNEQILRVFEEIKRAPREAGVAFVTSGTVGASKMVLRSAAGILSEAEAVTGALGLGPEMSMLITTPITHSYGFGLVMAASQAGAKVYTASQSNIYDRLGAVRDILNQESIDILAGVPYFFRLLLRQPAEGVPGVSYAGGEVVPAPLIEQWSEAYGTPLLQEYGLSEVGIVTIGRCEDPPESIGCPVGDVTIVIDGIDHLEELIVYRPGNPTAYLTGESPETFTRDGGVRTGDVGCVKDGCLYLTGRVKSVIRVGGLSVVPEEVEQALRDYPGVEEAVVVKDFHPLRGEAPIAYVTPASLESEESTLMMWLHHNLESFKVPREIYFVDELARTDSGKVSRDIRL